MVKHIILEKLTLRNFKGIKELTIDFAQNTNIFGDNGTGKTTISDSFRWLLFDKDSKDRSKFDIQPLGKDNKVIHMVDTEVEAALKINEKAITLKKVLKEKWIKKRGEAESELKGTETTYYIDEVPVKQTDYKKYINNLIDENIFKLITDPLYFSTNMKWADRRNVLMDIIGDITVDTVINYNSKLKPLEQLLGDKSIDEFKKSVSASIKKLKGDKESIPSRVDELNRAIKSDIDYEALEFRKRVINGSINSIDEKLMNGIAVNDELLKHKDHLYKLKSKLRDIEFNAKIEADKPIKQLSENIRKAETEENSLKLSLGRVDNKISSLESTINDTEEYLKKLREDWGVINQENLEIKEDDFICPTCRRSFEEHDIEVKKQEMIENFNQNKAKKLGSINLTGKQKKERLEELKTELERLKLEKESIIAKLEKASQEVKSSREKCSNFKPVINLDEDVEYQNTLGEIKILEDKVNAPVETSRELEELKAKKEFLKLDLESVNKDLSYKQINEEHRERITELLELEKSLSQQIAALEGKEFLCEEFIKTKVELLENSINSKFKYVSFKLFDTQVNGGLVETCEALINGVPFSNANTASQINAGLDIINALCSHYEVQAPIFIDNRESVNSLIETNSQVINLIVSKDKSLRVEVI